MKNIQERNNQNPFLEGKLIFPAHLNQSEREGFFMIKMAEEKMFRTWDLVMVFLATGSFSSKKSGMTGPAVSGTHSFPEMKAAAYGRRPLPLKKEFTKPSR